MRLLVINAWLGYSSTTSYSFELCRAMKKRGYDVRLCAGGGEQRELFRKEDIESFTVKSDFFSFRRLVQFLRQYDPHVIHVQNLRSLVLGQKISEHLKQPHVVTVHHVPTKVCDELRHPLLAGTIAVNEAVRESLVNSQRMQKELIRVIRTGVNLDRFKEGEAPLSRPDRIPVIGCIGRLSPVKGYKYLIAAARRVLDSGREAMFVIVGDGEEERQLRKQVRSLGIEKQVTFCPPLPDIVELIGNFDIAVLPTLRGGVGLTAMEALAMARPVVASAVGELLHVISDGTTGLLVREGDSEAIAEKIIHLLDHPDQARQLGQSGRKWVKENFALTPMIDATEQFYQEVVDEKRSNDLFSLSADGGRKG